MHDIGRIRRPEIDRGGLGGLHGRKFSEARRANNSGGGWLEIFPALYCSVLRVVSPEIIVKQPLIDAKQRLLNLDYQNQMAAISRVQAIIEFTLDGEIVTANENFCKTMGYSLDEIRGKHHSLFVERDYATSAEYAQFWSELRAGRFRQRNSRASARTARRSS